MDASLIVRPARVDDVARMARVHVRCWQETFRGVRVLAGLDPAEAEQLAKLLRRVLGL